ncbi:MAG: hypothetical protein SO122_05835 [Eubacteriales bacterium]|nr:hypothetical protein [Eubacteriales bacterium]
MIRFLSLHGDMTGSARINEQRSGVEVCLKLRSRMNSALQAFITDGKRIAAIRIVDGCGTGEYMNVRGLLVCGEGGELLAFGSVDMGRAEAEEFRTKVRFILNARAEKRRLQQSEYARRQQTAGPKQGEGAGRAEKPKPESPATAEILERAEQLFRGGVQAAKKPDAAEAEQAAKPMGKYPDTEHTERAEQLFRGGVQTAKKPAAAEAEQAAKPMGKYPDTEHTERAEQLFRGGAQAAKKPAAAEAEQEAKPMGKYPDTAHTERAEQAANPMGKHPDTEHTERAEQLFRGGVQTAKKPAAAEEEQAAKPMGKHPDTAHTEREAVENPFPSFFENSYWWREVNDNTRIFGVANIRGIKYRIVAVRSNAKYPPRGMGRNARRLISSGGKRYWVGLWKMQQM